jgi:hypothetical protein
MSYLSCPRCRLTIRIRAPYLAIRNCPRCLAHAGLPTPMYASPRRLTATALDEPAAIAPSPTRSPGTDGAAIPLRIVDSSGRSTEREPARLRKIS